MLSIETFISSCDPSFEPGRPSKAAVELGCVMLYICYTYNDIKVGLCFKALVTHLALGHVTGARVILM